ncbi:MAG: UvrD-helicase domain-containing protein [Nitrospiraceae bacterium]
MTDLSSTAPEPSFHDDTDERRRAETTFDRNVVVVAGAGTGKTTLLVNRMVHLLVKEPDPIPVTWLLALTFTNKAALEMKARLRERLQGLMSAATALTGGLDATIVAADDTTSDRQAPRGTGGAVSLHDLCARYSLSVEAVAERATAALHDVEKAQIGTMHSFAAHLLRLFPIESGLDPAFREDDGSQFDEQFAEEWAEWIGQELAHNSLREDFWISILTTGRLEQVETFARALCEESFDLEAARAQLQACDRWQAYPFVASNSDTALDERTVAARFRTAASRTRQLYETHRQKRVAKIDRMLEAAASLFDLLAEHGPAGVARFPDDCRVDLTGKANQTKAWDDVSFAEASSLIDLAKEALEINHDFFHRLFEALTPFVVRMRERRRREGWVSFDGLLVRARNLMRDHPQVRERLKTDYRAILVDEFQDTDPLQYEIVLALSERPGQSARRWQEMALEPGKLCIVGDPKQSIYAFRRADIEAFDRVVDQVLADQGIACRITTNFRSDPSVLTPINAIFNRAFVRRQHVQPENVPLAASTTRRSTPHADGVRLRLVQPAQDETFRAEDAAKAEAESLARWIAEEVLPEGRLRLSDIALLFRALTHAEVYLEALRRHGIPYIVEGEKHFYRRQEIIDAVNLLRVVASPTDELAWLGVLRSSLGALPDRAIQALWDRGVSGRRVTREALRDWADPARDHLLDLLSTLETLRAVMPTLPLPDAIDALYARLPLLELAAASQHGEQAVANLMKLRRLAANRSADPAWTLPHFVAHLQTLIDDPPDEAEQPITEDHADALRIFTIHKAKGLEFPMVVLPGLHQGTGGGWGHRTSTMHDWSSGLYGLSCAGHVTLPSLFLRQAFAVREAAERQRALYVGMTRARDRLVLSGSRVARPKHDSVFRLLETVSGTQLFEGTPAQLTLGDVTVPVAQLTAPVRHHAAIHAADAHESDTWIPSEVIALWQRRTAAWESARTTARRITPNQLTSSISSPRQTSITSTTPNLARLVGTCIHAVLQHWRTDETRELLLARIDPVAINYGKDLQPDEQIVLTRQIREVLTGFLQSALFARLQRSEILAQELPFFMTTAASNTTAPPQLIEGTIDLVYRDGGEVWVADYKSDALEAANDSPGPDVVETAAARADRYRPQLEQYRQAVAESLRLPTQEVGMELIFVRSGEAVRWRD